MRTLKPFLLFISLLGIALFGCKLAYRDNVVSGQVITGHFVFCGRPTGSERFDMFFLDLTTNELLNLTEKYISNVDDAFFHSIGCDDDAFPYLSTGAAWSPDGDLLIVNAGGPYFHVPYILEISARGEINRIVAQWPEPRFGKHIYVEPEQFSWSPDRDKVSFVAFPDYDGYLNLFVGDVSDWELSTPDTAVTQITHENRDWPGIILDSSWSPDGQKIAVFLAGPTSGIIILSADGVQSILVSDETSPQLSSVENPFPWGEFFPSI